MHTVATLFPARRSTSRSLGNGVLIGDVVGSGDTKKAVEAATIRNLELCLFDMLSRTRYPSQ